jgi:tRNA (cmo5U34)-methyltransferase
MYSFDFSKVENFDDHISRSIPNMEYLDLLLDRIMFDFAQPATSVVDIGCSTGRLLRSASKREDVSYIGIDRDIVPTPCDGVRFVNADVFDFEIPRASVVCAIFTAQFLPFARRQEFFDLCFSALVSGGVLLVAEKTHSNSHRLESSLQAQLMNHKRRTFDDTEIVDKAVSLAPVMHQQTVSGLLGELAAFSFVDPIWRAGSFACYAAIKQ